MFRLRIATVGVWLFMLPVLNGCVNPLTRLHPDEEQVREKEIKDVLVVGDITEVSNVGPLGISGVGLVSGLPGTGGFPPATNEFRKVLKDELLKRKVKDVDSLFKSKECA